MPERHADRIAPTTEESAATGGHHVRQVLVASLIGAILVMIAIATVSFH
jgi:predicted secreted protein